MSFADADARKRIETDLDATLVVEAAAGTGKTTVLVDRIVAVVAAGHRGATLETIISVTFSEKAAGEMKLRLRGALEKAMRAKGVDAAAAARLERALKELEVARIGTIHALCSDLLREDPVAARVDPMFEVATDAESPVLLDAAFDTWFPRVLQDPPEGIRRLLRRRARRRDQTPPREHLRSAASRLIEHRDFDAPWRRPAYERNAELDALVPVLKELGELSKQGDSDDYLQKNLAEIRRFVEDLAHREAVAPRDHDGLEAALNELSRLRNWKHRGFGRQYGRNLVRAEVLAKRDAARATLESLIARCDADLAALLRGELLPLVALYEEAKSRSGKLDFFDLLLETRNLLRDNHAVRQALQQRFTHLFVDEFQDTDPLQADILRLLAANDPAENDPARAKSVPGKLFIVGDPKQSIYRFRRADVALYEGVKRGLLASGAALLDLTTSFRASPPIQQAVNAAFSAVMGEGSATQARYVPLTRFRPALPHQPSVVALPVPHPYADYGKVVTWKIDESYPDALGAFVDFLLRQSGWKVREPGQSEPVPVQARHVCILFRRFQKWGEDLTKGYVRALETRRIPHVLVGGRSFYAREEVLALRNALTAIEWPDDELAVYATLKSPLFALSDDQLLQFRAVAGRLHPLKPLELDKLGPAAREVASGLALLKALHPGRNRRPISDTIAELLEVTRAHAGLAFWPAGEQALANLAQLMDEARRFEAAGGSSFRAFVERLAEESESGKAPEAPIVEEGTEGVRMMTVHGAKGLEFPVVLLADPTAPHTHRNPSHWVDPAARLWAEPLAGCVPLELSEHKDEVLSRDREESMRLTYVAATRACDLLVVPVVGDARVEGWVDVLHPALYPSLRDMRSPRPAPGCPAFGTESVLDRPADARYDFTVSPGLHKPEVGEHEVVWWDPKLLALGAGHDAGLARDDVLREDRGGEANATAGRAEYQAWEERRTALIARGAVPAIEVVAAAEAGVPAATPVEHATTAPDRSNRPKGRRFGELVHAALAALPLDAKPVAVEKAVKHLGRTLGSAPEEVAAAVLAARAALGHPVMKAAGKSDELRRETWVTLALDDGRLAEGVVDLAYRDAGGWVVVDFKTADEVEAFRAGYEAQVALYAAAISRATGQPTRAVLLAV